MQAVKEGQTTLISWHPLFAGLNIQRKLDNICLLNEFLVFSSEEIWVTPSYITSSLTVLLLLYTKSISCLNSFLRYKTFGNPAI